MLHLLYCLYFAALFFPTGLTGQFNNTFEVEDSEFLNDFSNAPDSFNSGTFQDIQTENQSPDDTALLIANDEVDPANSIDLTPMADWDAGDGLVVPGQDVSIDGSDDNSINGWQGTAPASTPLDIADPSSDPSTSSGVLDTGYLMATSPTDYLGGPLKQLNIPLPDVMSIFEAKCPPIRRGDVLVPLCCTGGRVGQSVTECRPYDITNWNCYFHAYQYCCRLFITESQEGVSCLRGFS